MNSIYKYWKALKHVGVVTVSIVMIVGAIHFPYDVDAPLTEQELEAARKYYTDAYRKPVEENKDKSEYETKYIRVAEAAAKTARIEERVSEFVKQFKLSDTEVLEIGSGRGYLQDTAEKYTGLDICPTVARFYHKKFVLGSATAMPFADDTFDGFGQFGCSSMFLIQSRLFARRGVSHEITEYFTYYRLGTAHLGRPRVTRSGLILISTQLAKSSKQAYHYAPRPLL